MLIRHLSSLHKFVMCLKTICKYNKSSSTKFRHWTFFGGGGGVVTMQRQSLLSKFCFLLASKCYQIFFFHQLMHKWTLKHFTIELMHNMQFVDTIKVIKYLKVLQHVSDHKGSTIRGPLWSETCWSTFKYFITLIVPTNCILCISWIIKWLIFIDVRCKHEDWCDSELS